MQISRLSRGRRPTGTALTEFGPVLFVLMIVVFFPAVNLLGLATGAATLLLFTNEAVSSAACQEGYNNSLAAMSASASHQLNGGFAKFANLRATGGFASCGVDLYTRITNVTGQTTQVGPNEPLNTPVDLSDNIYEFIGISKCTIGPVISMSSVPLFSEVPGLGKPASLEIRATRMVEHPAGLTYATAGAGGQMPSVFSRALVSMGGSSTSTPSAGYNYAQWRLPNIFDQIAQAGQSVVSVNVTVVQSNQAWQQSGVMVMPGQSAWIDTSAVGTWNCAPNTAFYDANGQGAGANIYNVVKGAPGACLVGYYGSNPPVPVPLNSGVSGATLFFVGDTLTNHPLTGPGYLYFMMNDNCFQDNSGNQLVRIIVTQ
jgi:hypothetical protein